ncbi:hypothetical protein CCHR01_02655 [Colletotrichum chrysophilum]|uniref:Uncharacterized protein n=1 Tax=Colletotrichum chrysophilum TaxID=1836956 RepID=A0AAD9EK53_9PEZI|nr:hypothetical protein CCHR01_02655 [Colletotrichum chrysophilum]
MILRTLNRFQQSKESSSTTTPFGKIPTGCKDQEQRRDRGFARIRNLPGVRFPPFNPPATSFPFSAPVRAAGGVLVCSGKKKGNASLQQPNFGKRPRGKRQKKTISQTATPKLPSSPRALPHTQTLTAPFILDVSDPSVEGTMEGATAANQPCGPPTNTGRPLRNDDGHLQQYRKQHLTPARTTAAIPTSAVPNGAFHVKTGRIETSRSLS